MGAVGQKAKSVDAGVDAAAKAAEPDARTPTRLKQITRVNRRWCGTSFRLTRHIVAAGAALIVTYRRYNPRAGRSTQASRINEHNRNYVLARRLAYLLKKSPRRLVK